MSLEGEYSRGQQNEFSEKEIHNGTRARLAMAGFLRSKNLEII
jgi:hypothetical protein